jgi:hypothetical protein
MYLEHALSPLFQEKRAVEKLQLKWICVFDSYIYIYIYICVCVYVYRYIYMSLSSRFTCTIYISQIV